ncbi:hypothetical protein GGR53DRAFT_36420 [Hypoxylon sp. FL1150]|nr:hypothetical protein GGR53DRAFT_36420 [Hypoxylon sp. FL1150]
MHLASQTIRTCEFNLFSSNQDETDLSILTCMLLYQRDQDFTLKKSILQSTSPNLSYSRGSSTTSSTISGPDPRGNKEKRKSDLACVLSARVPTVHKLSTGDATILSSLPYHLIVCNLEILEILPLSIEYLQTLPNPPVQTSTGVQPNLVGLSCPLIRKQNVTRRPLFRVSTCHRQFPNLLPARPPQRKSGGAVFRTRSY